MTIKIKQMTMHGRVFLEFQDRCIQPLCHSSDRDLIIGFLRCYQGVKQKIFDQQKGQILNSLMHWQHFWQHTLKIDTGCTFCMFIKL